MNTPSPPPVPSASSIVQASQTANNVNQQTPFGSLNYTQGPNGQYTATQTADPNVVSGVQQNLQKFNAQGGPADPSQAITQAIGMENKYMQPTFNQQQSALDSRLQNQGFSVGSAGYQNAQRDLQNNQNNWVGGNVAQFEPLAYNQSQTSYFDPLQAAQGLRTTGAPNFVSTPQTDVTGAYNTQMQGNEYNYGQQMQNNNAMLGGLFSIPSAAAGGWARAGFPGVSSLFGGAGAGADISGASMAGLTNALGAAAII
jgi:hypothetical protein